jgi:hypothetical protein
MTLESGSSLFAEHRIVHSFHSTGLVDMCAALLSTNTKSVSKIQIPHYIVAIAYFGRSILNAE